MRDANPCDRGAVGWCDRVGRRWVVGSALVRRAHFIWRPRGAWNIQRTPINFSFPSFLVSLSSILYSATCQYPACGPCMLTLIVHPLMASICQTLLRLSSLDRPIVSSYSRRKRDSEPAAHHHHGPYFFYSAVLVPLPFFVFVFVYI